MEKGGAARSDRVTKSRETRRGYDTAMSSRPTIPDEQREVRVNITARHEAAHAVIAAVLGLRLRSEGMAVDRDGEGLTCYCKQPGETDSSRQRIVIATHAGFRAQKRYSEQNGHQVPDEMARAWSDDSKWARKVGGSFSDAYLGERGFGAVDMDLDAAAEDMVGRYWDVIEALAQALLAKDWEPVKPLGSGGTWATATEAKYLVGADIVSELKNWKIPATCVDEC